MRRTAVAVASWTFLVASMAVPASTAAPGGGDGAEIVLDRIWFRTERIRSLPKAFKGNGDLRLGPDGIEFLHKTKSWFLPWNLVRRISLGPMKGDVDTDWVVLSAPDSDLGPLVGLRDGTRMGYGQRTEPIFQQIKEAARRARAGQFDVPQGFTTYEGLEHLLTLALPSDWSEEHRTAVVQDGRVQEGVVVFHEPPDPQGAQDAPASREARAERLRAAVDRGDVRSIRLERRPTSKGMKEDGFSDAAVQQIADEMLRDRDQLGGLDVHESPETAPIPLDGRVGVRIRAVGAGGSGASYHVDTVAVCDGRMLFLFRSRGPAARRQEDRALLDEVLGTVRFSLTR